MFSLNITFPGGEYATNLVQSSTETPMPLIEPQSACDVRLGRHNGDT